MAKLRRIDLIRQRGEAFNLTWADIDELKGFVEFKPKDGWTPKTSKSCRGVPVSDEMLNTLRRLPKSSSYVFPGKRPDRPIDNIRKAFASAVCKAGILRDGHPMPASLEKLHGATELLGRGHVGE